MKKDKRKKWLASAAALAAVAALVGTFAWFTSTDDAQNEFEGDLAGNDIEIVEDFIPPKPWEPGEEVNKDVAVKNNGKINSLIRISLTETVSKLVDHKSYFATTEAEATGLTGADVKFFVFELGQRDLTGFTDIKTDKEYKLELTKPQADKQKGKYTFKVKEKSITDNKGTLKYEYVSYWQHDSNPEVKLYAKTGGFTRTDANGPTIPEAFVTPKNTPQFQYVNLAMKTEVNEWKTTKPNLVTNPAIPAGGNTTIILSSPTDPNIKVKLVNLSSTPTKGQWIYNKADGMFYFVGVVKPQEQTAQLVDSVTLDSSVGNEYSKVKYVLDVHAKGIQAIADAVTSDEFLGNSNTTISDAIKALPEVKKNN